MLSRHGTALTNLAREEYLLLDVDFCIKHGVNDYSELAPSCEEGMVLTRQIGYKYYFKTKKRDLKGMRY